MKPPPVEPVPPEGVMLVAADLEQPRCFSFLGGEVVAFTRPCPGVDGRTNEDACAILPWDGKSGVLVVADGVGGLPAGGDAARITIRAIRDALTAGRRDEIELRDAVLRGIDEGNRKVLADGRGAATTVAVAQIRGRRVRSIHVGDSGVVITGQRGRVKLMTVFHSPVGYAMEAGLLDEEEAIQHEERHLVSNLVGTEDMRIELGSAIELAARDTVLVASDGLFDNFLPTEIVEKVRKGGLATVAGTLAREVHGRMEKEVAGQPSKPDDLSFLLFRPIAAAAPSA